MVMVLQLICTIRKRLQVYTIILKACHRVNTRLISSQSRFIARFIFVPLMRIFMTNCVTSNDFGINKKGISVKGICSSIRDHINETGHAMSFDDFCILDKANNNFDLLIHESLLILRDRPTLNQQNSSIPLYTF